LTFVEPWPRCHDVWTFVKQDLDIRLVITDDGGMPKALPVLDTTDPVRAAALASGPVGEQDALAIALRLKALADPVRVRLMSLILAQAEHGVCTCDLAPAVGVTEATASHHLKQLREAGLVEGTKKGTNTYYRPRTESLGALCRVIDPACC
jgi:ArsR family transcriptional regulator, arsenate/arsenite/antimonite-responsive transcriptional repressor